MYKQKLVTLNELWADGKHHQRSLTALRARAAEGILVYVSASGATHQFDEELSLIREHAAARCKRPGATWRSIARAMNSLDRAGLNQKLVRMLNDENRPRKDAIEFVIREVEKFLD